MHYVAGEIACAEGCAETISANVLKPMPGHYSGIPKYTQLHKRVQSGLRHTSIPSRENNGILFEVNFLLHNFMRG